MTKNELRTYLKGARQDLSEAERQKKSAIIAEQLFYTQEWQHADTIHSYRSFRTEVTTDTIITRAWSEGKNVFVPIIEPTTSEMLHAKITPDTRFFTDSFGIPTPQFFQNDAQDEQKKTPKSSSIIDSQAACIIVPLLGFDKECYRIGYGKGHYDRFFADLSGKVFPHIEKNYIVKIGCAFQCQFVQELPCEAHDIPLDMVITEERIYRP